MANDQQIAVKKRLIYAEDLFEPVDFTVLHIGGRSSGKTMAMYEQLFRKRVELAPTIDAVEVVRCKDCKFYDSEDGVCTIKYDELEQYLGVLSMGYCSDGERRADHVDNPVART